MLWHCQYTWLPGTSQEDVRQRFLALHDGSGGKIKQHIKAWYHLAGGGAGVLIMDTTDAQELTELLQPFMTVLTVDVRGVAELQYDRAVERFRQAG